MTRLADITGLDRIGMPVWQAVRPWGKSLSVHQGKGLDADQARLGACMEAIETAHAEDWAGATTLAAHDDLPPAERSPAADDFGTRRGSLDPARPIAWTAADALTPEGGRIWVPAAAVALDLTRPGTPGIDCSSNGQGAGFDLDFATYKALCELIERDAVAAWGQRSVHARMFDGIALDSIDFPWFRSLHARLRALGISLRVFRLPAVIAVPALAAEIYDRSGEAAARPRSAGTSAHADPEVALRAALTEAIQSRLTVIAGTRDDLALSPPEAAPADFGAALAPSRPLALPSFAALWPAPAPASAAAALAALADAGYPHAARIILSPPGCPVTTAKVFVPGLGAFGRERRAPAPRSPSLAGPTVSDQEILRPAARV